MLSHGLLTMEWNAFEGDRVLLKGKDDKKKIIINDDRWWLMARASVSDRETKQKANANNTTPQHCMVILQ